MSEFSAAPPPAPIRISCRRCRTKLDVSELKPFSRVDCPVCGISLRIPRRFDRYLLEKRCGVGGMSKIYRALDPVLERRVAIKILDASAVEEGRPSFFFREAQLIADLDHHGIIPVYHSGIAEGSPFLVMRYMAGGDLEGRLKRGELPPRRQLLGIFAVVAEALSFILAEKRLVHHDVKPSNILLDEAGRAQLGDFDLADVREFGEVERACEEWGSPGYISPERLYYGGEDHRGDIFSLGASIYELFSGVTPFGIAGEAAEHYERRRKMEFAPLMEIAPGVSPQLSELVGRMLAFDAAERPGYQEIIRHLHRESIAN